MLWILALALIFLGLFLIIRGLTEEVKIEPYEITPDLVEEDFERLEEEFEEKHMKKKKREVKAGGVVLIGPIPIVFGDSKYAVYALILTIVLMVMSIILLLSLSL
jgi:uncharacterized protein (TIGR00304 family)